MCHRGPVTTGSSFYLGPTASRLLASSWEDMVSAQAAGSLDETQWVERKQAVPPTSKPANRELAKDLASLSVDGGVFIVGITDDGNVVGTQDIAGLETRITQVAAAQIYPPLTTTTTKFDKPGEPGTGLLVVTVPASAGAPHMVNETYWGRTAEGKRALGDDEVRRLLEDRRGRAAGFDNRLAAVPAAIDQTEAWAQPRMYVLLEPGAAAPDTFAAEVARPYFLHLVEAALQPFRPQFNPTLRSLQYLRAHPDGLALATLPPDEAVTRQEDFLTVLLTDAGSLQISAPIGRAWRDTPYVVSSAQAIELLHSALLLAAHVAAKYTGYQGLWRCGVLVTGMRGLLPSQSQRENSSRYQPFASNTYQRAVTSTTAEMAETASTPVLNLLRGLLRGLGVQKLFEGYTDPTELERRNRDR